MTLNANFAGATLMPGGGRLAGPDRGLDALIGLVILVAELLIGSQALYALYLAGNAYVETTPSARGGVEAGFAIAMFGTAIAVGFTTLIYLVRIASARRSWRAPLWGAILMTAALFAGYLVMAGGL
jgi:hypothetical protein